ncbi:MAG: translocation/assembly module TamB domain-containing protein, partial [Gammaproteobacteria bacterium]
MIKAIIRSILSIILVLLAIFAFFSCSSLGLQLLIKTISIVIPGTLQATVVDGHLLGNMHLKQITYHDNEMYLSIDDVEIRWYFNHYSPLVIAIPHLQLSGLKINYPDKNTIAYSINQTRLNGQLAMNDIAVNDDNKNRNSIPDSEKTYFTIHFVNMFIPGSTSFNITLPTGNLFFDGPLMNYHVHGVFTSRGTNFPQATWHLNEAHGNFEHIQIASLTGTPLAGNATLSAQVEWVPDIKWDAQLSGTQLNLASEWKMPENNLNLQLHSQGLITKTQSEYRFEINQLTGHIRDFPVTGKGNFLISTDDYLFQNLVMNFGDAHININGAVTPTQANLAWQLQIPDLSHLITDAKGRIDNSGYINGSLKKPHIVSKLIVNNAAWSNIIAKTILAQLDAYPNLIDASQLQITITDLFAGNLQVNSAAIQLRNQQQQNSLTIDLRGPHSQFNANVAGKFVATQWQGKINQFKLAMHDIGSIQLNNAANLTLTPHSFALQPFCLQATIGQTCIQQANFAIKYLNKNIKSKSNKKNIAIASNSLNGALQFSSHDLAFISVFWPQVSNVRGSFNANFSIAGTTTNPVVIGQANLNNSSLSIPRLGISINNILFHATGNQNNLTYNAQAKFGSNLLNINGNTNLAKSGFPTSISVKGNNLLIMDTSDAVVYASPDLQFDWLSPLLKITGSIIIPTANITPRDLTSTITLPKDVVFVTPDQKTQKQNTHIYSHIQISMGNNVRVSYSGLSGNVIGAVTVEDKPGGDTTGSGLLAIENGRFNAYGQDLSIR